MRSPIICGCSCSAAELSRCDRNHIEPANPKYVLSCPLQKKLIDPCSTLLLPGNLSTVLSPKNTSPFKVYLIYVHHSILHPPTNLQDICAPGSAAPCYLVLLVHCSHLTRFHPVDNLSNTLILYVLSSTLIIIICTPEAIHKAHLKLFYPIKISFYISLFCAATTLFMVILISSPSFPFVTFR